MGHGGGGRDQKGIHGRHDRRQHGRDDQSCEQSREQVRRQLVKQRLTVETFAHQGAARKRENRHADKDDDTPTHRNGKAAPTRHVILHGHQACHQMRLPQRAQTD